jgi:hypothetical protein
MRSALSRPRLTRCFAPIAATLLAAGVPLAAAGESVPARDWLPEKSLAVVEISRPTRLLEHPLVRAIHDELANSHEIQARLDSPEYDRVRLVQRFLEQTTGLEWGEALDRLTAGGLVLAVVGREPPKLVSIVTAGDAEVLERFIAGTREQVLSRVPAAARERVFVATEHAGETVWRVGQAWYAVVDRHLVLANEGDLVKHVIDRIAEAGPTSGTGAAAGLAVPSEARTAPADAAAPGESLLRASLSLAALRQVPGLDASLKLPAEDPAVIAFLGGWLDLLRNSDSLTADLSLDGEAIEMGVRLMGGRDRVTDGLEGYFATQDAEQPLPLLELQGTLYSATWFRDYASLWENRAKLLTEAAVRKMEDGDAAIRKQFSVFKVDFTPSEVFGQIGRQFRVVVARQQGTPYRVELQDKLPASALAVTLRDEQKFAEQYVPLTRAIGLIATFEQGVSTRESEHAGAKLVGWWFRDDPQAVASSNRARYNFTPTYSITRGHFILGSTREIVEQVIDELDRQAAGGGEALAQYVTERQSLSLTEVAESLRGIRESFVRGLAIGQGLTVAEAGQEFDVLAQVVAAIGRITTESKFTEEAFEYRVRIEPGE